MLVSSLTFSASANPVVYLGGRPTFIDSERTSWNMDPGLLEETLAARARAGKLPKAMIPVHLYGQSADMDPILAACARYGVPVIEDAAEALGAAYWGAAGPQPEKSGKSGASASHPLGRSPGTLGSAGIFSFNGNKIITTSGGRAVAQTLKVCKTFGVSAADGHSADGGGVGAGGGGGAGSWKGVTRGHGDGGTGEAVGRRAATASSFFGVSADAACVWWAVGV